MAMDFLPPAVVRLVADIKDFQAGMMKAETQLAGVGQGGMKAFGAVGAAAGLAALAVGTFAIKLGKDAVEAAIEDEKSMRMLNQTLINTGHAGSLPGVEQGISKMMQATGVADEELRPSLNRLILATGDVTKSQEGLQLALDISAGTGRDLSSVTSALSRAYSGNTGALGRLGVGLDAALLKSKDMDAITGELEKKFAGAASTAADTYAGRMRRLSTAASEAQEKVGYELLDAIDKITEAFGGTGGATAAIDDAGTALANWVQGVALGVESASSWVASLDDAAGSNDLFSGTLYAVANALSFGVLDAYRMIMGIGEDYNDQQKVINDSVAASENYYAQYIRTLGITADGVGNLSDQEQELADRAKEVKAAFLDLDNALSDRSSYLNYREGLANLGNELDATSKKLSGYSDGAIKNQKAVINILGDAEKSAKDWGEKTGASADQVQARFQQMVADIRQRLIDSGIKPSDVDMFFGSVGVWSGGGQAASANARQAGYLAGKALGDGVTAGINASEGKASGAAEDLMDAATRAARRRGKIESPSQVWYEIGSQLVEGLNNALGDKKGAAAEKARGIIEALGTEFDAAKERYQNTFDTLFDGLDLGHAVEQATATGSTIAYQFVAQADEAAKFGTKLQQLIAAGLNENTWNQIAGMSAAKGIQVADAYLNGNTAQMVADTNRAVNAARAVADETGKQAASAFAKAGTDSAIQTLEGLIKELLPEGKQRKRLMKVMDDLAEALKRTTKITIVEERVGAGGGGGGGGGGAGSAPTFVDTTGQTDIAVPAGSIPTGTGHGSWVNPATGAVEYFERGGYVSGKGPKPAVLHGGEFVLSGEMLAGRQGIPGDVARALRGSGQSITVNAQTNADPYAIGRELAWAMKVGM